MGQGALNYQGVKGGLDINGIIESYYAYAGENISAGDFVEFINGVASISTATTTDTPILTSTEEYKGYFINACKLNDSKVFIAHGIKSSSTYYLYGIVCSINGANITYGTDTQLSTDTYSAYYISAITLSSNKVFIAHSYGSSYFLRGMICSISGVTITHGSDYSLSSATYAGHQISCTLLETNKLFIAHNYGNTSSSNLLYGIICTISGTSISAGTDTELSSTSYTGLQPSVISLTSAKVFIAHRSTSDAFLAYIICTISGTSISAGDDTQKLTGNKQGMLLKAIKTNDNRILVVHSYSEVYYLYGIVFSISGTTVTSGTDTALNSTMIYSAQRMNLCELDIDKIYISHGSNVSISSDYLYGMVCTISGTTITNYEDTKLSTVPCSATYNSPILLENNKLFIAHSYTSDYNLYAQLFGISSNNIPTNIITVTNYETQVRKATSIPCNGVAKTKGIGGDEMAHNEQVKIYVPDI